MTSSQDVSRSRSDVSQLRGRTLLRAGGVLAGYIVPAILLCVGSAMKASLSGELPVYDPTPEEIRVWDLGSALMLAGGVLLAVWTALVLIFWRRLKLRWRAVVLLIAVGLTITLVTAIAVWIAVLPPLPVA